MNTDKNLRKNQKILKFWMNNQQDEQLAIPKGTDMKKNTLHKILTPILFVMIINQLVTALLSDKMSARTFEIIHQDAGYVLVGLVLVHVLLNFTWIKASYFPK